MAAATVGRMENQSFTGTLSLVLFTASLLFSLGPIVLHRNVYNDQISIRTNNILKQNKGYSSTTSSCGRVMETVCCSCLFICMRKVQQL